MGRKMFGKCYGCFCCYTKCKPSKNRISRKQKKQLKSYLLTPVSGMVHHYEDFSRCDLREAYKGAKKYFNLFKRFYQEIELIKSALDENGLQPIYINRNGRLCWQWELDCDVTGGTSGLMPFCYSKEEAGNTWAFDEVNDLFSYLYKSWRSPFPKYIKSDHQLLMYIKNNPVSKESEED